MKHYDSIEWMLYKKDLVSEQIKEEMNEHLILCDECMDIFLSLIEEEEILDAEKFIKEDFTEKVINKTKKIKLMKLKKKKKVMNDFFIFYTAVASVTVILTAGGFFGNLIEPRIYISKNMEEKQTRSLYNVSEDITNKTSDFIKNFSFGNKGGE